MKSTATIRPDASLDALRALLPNADTMTLDEAGTLTVEGVTQAELDAAVAAYDHLQVAKAVKIAEIKAEAHRRIVAIMPEYKQRNALARAFELQQAIMTNQTQAKAAQAELAALQAQWNRIKAIRDASNKMEAEVNALTDVAEVEGYEIGVTGTVWP